MPQLTRHHQALVERFAAALGQSLADEVDPTPRLLLAVSGGSDSMALLELAALARGIQGDVVAYVDHGLRPETTAEAELVRTAVQGWQGAFRCVALDVGRSDEATLRAARYRALAELAYEVGASFLVTGHTRDDQVETILHRLFRGAGRRGLSGMSARRDRLLRPLLGFGKEELRAFLDQRGVVWCEDPSNADPRYLRNRIRHGVVPALERELGRDCLDHLPDMARVWSEEEAYLEAEAARFGAFAERGPLADRRLDSAALIAAPSALRARIVRRWLAAHAGRASESFSRSELERVLELASDPQGTKRIHLSGVTVEASYGELRVPCEATKDASASEFAYSLSADRASAIVGPGGWTISVSQRNDGGGESPTSATHEICDFVRGRLARDLVVRSVKPGDRVAATQRGARKVQDLMVDARIPAPQRALWPLVESDGQVIWVPGIARDERFVAGEVGVERLRLRWRRGDVA